MAKLPSALTVLDNSKKLLKRIDTLVGLELLVGIPSNARERDSTGEKTEITNAEIGFLMENGSPANNIPARPSLIPGIRAGRDKIDEYLKQAGQAALEGKEGRMRRAYMAAGLSAQNSVKNYIQTGTFKILSEQTIYRRAHRKIAPRHSEKPLMDTLQFLKSFTYVLRG